MYAPVPAALVAYCNIPHGPSLGLGRSTLPGDIFSGRGVGVGGGGVHLTFEAVRLAPLAGMTIDRCSQLIAVAN